MEMVKLKIEEPKDVFEKVNAENKIAETIESGLLTPFEIINVALSFMRDEEGIISPIDIKKVTDMI
jgi:hypothetical protein